MNWWLAVGALWKREIVRFVRQPSRMAGAVLSPLVFWILIGSGLSGSFRLPGASPDIDFLRYFYPGTVALVLLFAAIFSTISVIEDRNQGFLQGVLVAPLPRSALVAGKVFGGATLAWLQGLVFLPLAPLAGIRLGLTQIAAAAGVMALVALAFTALGFAFAWRVDSTQGFHAVMNLVLVPLWLLSGAFFPLAGGPAWLEWTMRANPLTYGVAALRAALEGERVAAHLPPFGASVALLAMAAAAAFVGALLVVVLGRATGKPR